MAKKNVSENEEEYPFWHVKRQKAYKVHRVLMVIQIIVALILAFVIWWGSHTLLP